MVKNMDKKILAIGIATKDHIITPTDEYFQIGGAVFYQTMTLIQLNYNVKSIISIGKNDLEMIEPDYDNIHIIPTDESMEYINIYDKNFRRTQKAKLPKNPIQPKDIIVDLDDVITVILSPLSSYDIPVKTVAYFKENNIQTVLVPQGLLRKTNVKSEVISKEWDDIDEYLKYVDIISLDEKETKTAFKIDEISPTIMKNLIKKHDLKQIVVTKAEKGSAIYTENKTYHIPAIKTEKAIDATGLGDTYIAAYIAKLVECHDIYLSGLFASIAAKEKLENKGPLKTDKEEIEKELDKYR